MNENVKGDIRKFIVDNYLLGQDDDDFKDKTSLLDSGIIDSTGIMELIGHLEITYKFTMSMEEMIPDNLDTLNDIVFFIEEKTDDKG